MKSALPILLWACLLGACAQDSGPAPESGAVLFARHCAACHGPQGEGDGPVSSIMQVTVPNLRTLSERSGEQFPRDAVLEYVDGRNLPVAHGDRYMPIWGNVFGWAEDELEDPEPLVRQRIEAVTDFVEQLQY